MKEVFTFLISKSEPIFDKKFVKHRGNNRQLTPVRDYIEYWWVSELVPQKSKIFELENVLSLSCEWCLYLNFSSNLPVAILSFLFSEILDFFASIKFQYF